MAVRRATLRAFDAGAYTASLQVESTAASSYLTGVPVSRGIAAAEMVVGRAIALAAFSDDTPTDAMVVGVWA